MGLLVCLLVGGVRVSVGSSLVAAANTRATSLSSYHKRCVNDSCRSSHTGGHRGGFASPRVGE